MREVKNPKKVDFHVRYDPTLFGPVNSIDDIIDVYLEIDFGIVHFGASKEITDDQKKEVADKLNAQLGDVIQYIDANRK